MPITLAICAICLLNEDAVCAGCGQRACATCDRCAGCGQVVCERCDSEGSRALAFPGDAYPHPHRAIFFDRERSSDDGYPPISTRG